MCWRAAMEVSARAGRNKISVAFSSNDRGIRTTRVVPGLHKLEAGGAWLLLSDHPMYVELTGKQPFYLLRTEAFCALFASCAAYHLWFPDHWVMFACLFLVPDLSLLMYLRGPNAVASIVYNLVHTYVVPALLGIFAVLFRNALLAEVSLIWISHIGLDRMLGYGLKYPTSFQFTHIQSAANPVIVSTPPRAQHE